MPQALVNFHIENKSALSSNSVENFIAEQSVRLGSSGRILVRPSGTEPLARVMVEAENADELAAYIAEELQRIIKHIPGAV